MGAGEQGPHHGDPLDELYATAPPFFVERRTQLAAHAVVAGRAGDARVIRAARRPTLAAGKTAGESAGPGTGCGPCATPTRTLSCTPSSAASSRPAGATQTGRPAGPHDRARTGHVRQELGEDAAAITPRELTLLLEGGWRERKTAAWFIAVARRTEFRGLLGEMLLASEVGHAGTAYCVTLATFATTADADLLAAYLDHYLRRPDLYYDQPAALGALLHIDERLGTEQAARFTAPGGLWPQWIDGPPRKEHHTTPDNYRGAVGELCAFVDESARHLPGEER
ncbi:DUF6000 family protein [Streptomyces zhihengii]